MTDDDLPVPNYEGFTARVIAACGRFGPDDFYHRNVQRAAAKLSREGPSNVIYGGQYASGTTWWHRPEGGTVAVERQGD